MDEQKKEELVKRWQAMSPEDRMKVILAIADQVNKIRSQQDQLTVNPCQDQKVVVK